MNEQIVQLLQLGYSIVTPTVRLGRVLDNQYVVLQKKAKLKTWERPDILPWQAWIKRSWEEHTHYVNEGALSLSAWQQYNVWLEVIQRSEYAEQLLQSTMVAKKAVQAWNLYHQWQIPLYPKDTYISQDVRAFQMWANAYEQKCREQHWIDDAGIMDILTKESGQTGQGNENVAFVGFDFFHPQQERLIAALRKSGVSVEIIESSILDSQIKTMGFTHVDDEIRGAASWARQQLESRPEDSIGIVIPNIQQLRTKVLDLFEEVLDTNSTLEHAGSQSLPFSISIGQSLPLYPLIDTAFSILSLGLTSNSVKDLTCLLSSPFIQGAERELLSRFLLDAAIREYGEQKISINTLRYIANQKLDEKNSCHDFLNCLALWQEQRQQMPEKQTANAWISSFTELLNALGWPGERSLSSAEYQVIEAWKDLLSQFTLTDVVKSKMTYSAALSSLRQLASQFSFQPETSETPIQILGHEGAAGIHFDHLWILGLHEEAWPLATEPVAFIPFFLQRQYGLPMASAEHRLAYSKDLTQKLVGSSPNVVISYPQNELDRPLKPSPLIRSYINASEDLADEFIGYESLVFSSRKLEEFCDEKAPIIEDGELVKGGTAIFKDQAACPFRAFARHRLHAHGLPDIDIGLNAMERGLLVHAVLQRIWQKMDAHDTLTSLSDEALRDLITTSIRDVLVPLEKQRPDTFSTQFNLLETQRLSALMLEWLNIEKQRQSFKVLACEQERVFEFANMSVRARIDRIDRLDDGQELIIDYKTGPARTGSWFDTRPDEPQLPLYASCAEAEPAAILFASIKPGEAKFVGLANANDIVPSVKAFEDIKLSNDIGDWSDLMTQWRETLNNIAMDFKQGDARVDPKNTLSCRYCDLQTFCRIYAKGKGLVPISTEDDD